MSNFMLSVACPLALFIGGCALDPDRSSDGSTGSVDQATTVLDDCAVDHAPNAREDVAFNSPQTYTRKGDPTINSTCDCKAWQKEANANGTDQADSLHPLCRSTTFVNVRWATEFADAPFSVEVPSWSLTNGDTECRNSTLTVSVWKFDSTNTWVKQGPTQTVHPVPNGSGICGSASISGFGNATGELYRIHALATRGLDDNNHGFETVKISASLVPHVP
jgi:hypothetical protein